MTKWLSIREILSIVESLTDQTKLSHKPIPFNGSKQISSLDSKTKTIINNILLFWWNQIFKVLMDSFNPNFLTTSETNSFLYINQSRFTSLYVNMLFIKSILNAQLMTFAYDTNLIIRDYGDDIHCINIKNETSTSLFHLSD